MVIYLCGVVTTQRMETWRESKHTVALSEDGAERRQLYNATLFTYIG